VVVCVDCRVRRWWPLHALRCVSGQGAWDLLHVCAHCIQCCGRGRHCQRQGSGTPAWLALHIAFSIAHGAASFNGGWACVHCVALRSVSLPGRMGTCMHRAAACHFHRQGTG
jgi:hypothetical protein